MITIFAGRAAMYIPAIQAGKSSLSTFHGQLPNLPHRQHPSFKPPSSPDDKVWRYLDLPKFVSMVQNRALYFVRSTEFEDPYEGTTPEFNVKRREQWMREHKTLYATEEVLQAALKSYNESDARENYMMAVECLVNSWHLNDEESASMWKLYSDNNSGIAIQSTFQRLCDSFQSNSADVVYAGVVEYIDYRKQGTDPSNGFNNFLVKRKSFACEREIRLATVPSSGLWAKLRELKGLKPNENMTSSFEEIQAAANMMDKGKSIPTDLQVLIERVYVAPMAPTWYLNMVNYLLKQYLPSKQATKSELYDLK